ncbi:MAG TPA: hypothetical protein VF904_07770 [Anaeromyxobacteraceae bacterium]
MLAYKFLSAGAVAPFTGRPWPLPGPRAPGAWIFAPPGDLARYGVHACRMEDLSYWLDEELWLVELGEPIVPTPFHVAAGRGRLLQRITAWNAASAREYAAACAWRARDLVAEALSRAALDAEASALRACIDLVSLQATATAIAGDAARDEPRGLVAYAAGAALRARQGRFPEASLQCAHLGAALTGSEAGAGCERAWQARWLAHRLELREIAARSGVGAFPV